MDTCTFPSCNDSVSKPGYKFCYKHWKESKGAQEPQPNKSASISLLSTTKLAEAFEVSSRRINPVLSELGWISKEKKGWVATAQGEALGAVQKEHFQTGIPYVLWPETIQENKALSKTIRDLKGEEAPLEVGESEEVGFRERFPATYRATDGHMVRSRAEMLVDNWLYMSGLVHAYERLLPIEEELYCDFYLPEGKVYVEYWGLENDPKYAARKRVKQDIYSKYNLNLIELSDEHIKNLDDHLPKMLLKCNVIVT